MIVFRLTVFTLLVYSFSFPVQSQEKEYPDAECIITKSQERHDPDNLWDSTTLSVHIQEPRVQNFKRYSQLVLNNSSGYFELTRSYEAGEVKRVINEKGEALILLNGSEQIPDDIRENNGLYESRNAGYQRFYQFYYGLPMSIQADEVANIHEPEEMEFQGDSVYAVSVELREPLITLHWVLLIDREDYRLRGVILDHGDESDEPNEMIEFDGSFKWKGMNLPRFRHWYEETTESYLGSDIMLEVSEE